jgi:hypothetical protein
LSIKKVAKGSNEAIRIIKKVVAFHCIILFNKIAKPIYPINKNPWLIPIGYNNCLYTSKKVGFSRSILANKSK